VARYYTQAEDQSKAYKKGNQRRSVLRRIW
jgi:hypothetical protein